MGNMARRKSKRMDVAAWVMPKATVWVWEMHLPGCLGFHIFSMGWQLARRLMMEAMVAKEVRQMMPQRKILYAFWRFTIRRRKMQRETRASMHAVRLGAMVILLHLEAWTLSYSER